MKRKSIPFDLYMEIAVRDKYTCQMCWKVGEFKKFWSKGIKLNIGIYHEGKRFEIDHIKPISKGGEHTKENMRLTCMRCNRSKGHKYAI